MEKNWQTTGLTLIYEYILPREKGWGKTEVSHFRRPLIANF